MRRWTTMVTGALVCALALGACSSSGEGGNGAGGPSGPGPTRKAAGTLVLGAEQEPDCADWIGSCAGSAWGLWTIQVHTIPRVFDYRKQAGVWTEVPSPLLAGAPEVSERDGKQVVTYRLNPAARWSDGTPITSADFRFTWRAVVDGEDIYDKTGYDLIESVDDSDPRTVVVTFRERYASWRGLFAAYGVLPRHLLEGKDRAEEMADGYEWSGGPWIARWRKGESVTLTPNPRWWGPPPKLAKVVFKFLASSAAEFKAFESRTVKAIYPQPQLEVVGKVTRRDPQARRFVTTETGNVEALWVNNDRFPFDDVRVRQAFAYAVDREAIVRRLFGRLGVTEPVHSFNPPIQSRYAAPAFERYRADPRRVEELMRAAGFRRDGDGPWRKDGRVAEVVLTTTTGNKRRELTLQILQEQLRRAGFRARIGNLPPADLFGEHLPNGDFQVALYAQVVTTLDPGLCVVFCAKNIPGPDNDHSGQNFTRTRVPEADPFLERVDVEADEQERIAASKRADELLAEAMVSLPLDPLPNIGLWDRRIEGPVADNPVLGMFWNVHEWRCRGGRC